MSTLVETWKPCPGYEHYEVSDQGRVRALPRTDRLGRQYAAKVLSPGENKTRMVVCLTRDGVEQMHGLGPLVLEAFIGPKPDGMVCRHLDGDKKNCALSNLEWATQSQNMLDRRTHGTDHQVSKTHCPQGHPYAGDNLVINSKGRRECRICKNESNRRYRERTI